MRMAMNGVYDDLKATWDSAVSAFQEKEQAFKDAMSDLVNNRDRYYAAGLGDQYDTVYNRGLVIQTSVTSVLDAISSAYSWLKNAMGLSVLPAIPFATMAAVAGVIAAFLLTYKALQTALQEYEIRQLPADQQTAARQNILNQPTLSSDIKQTIFGVLGIAAVIFVLPKLLEGRHGNR